MADIVGRFKRWKSYKKFTKLGNMQEETYFNEKPSISEKASIRDFSKKNCYGSTSYGSGTTSKRVHRTEVLIKHDLSKNETLQGIALKYGCSMEQIRRANRLFANDSLFLREFLMIPVDKDSAYYPKDAERPHSFQIRSNSIAGSSSSSSKDQLDSPNSPNRSSLDSLATLTSPDEEQRKNMEEFLDKIDSSIATSKKFVQQQQKINGDLSTSQSEDNLYSSYGNGGNGNSFNNHLYDASSSNSSYQQYYAPSSSHQQARFSLAGGSNSSDTTQLIVMTSGKRVKNSLQRLEKNHDELFEL